MRKFKVEIPYDIPELDAIGPFDAYTNGERWNGWACPLFTKEQGLRVIEWVNQVRRYFDSDEHKMWLWWDEAEQVFWYVDTDMIDSSERPEPIQPSTTTDDGEALYPIGAFGWTWEEA